VVYDFSGFGLLENTLTKMIADQAATPSLFAGNSSIAATYVCAPKPDATGIIIAGTGANVSGFSNSGPATVTTQQLRTRLAARATTRASRSRTSARRRSRALG
jgi:hypothetical protein